jgi:hypothetical protein
MATALDDAHHGARRDRDPQGGHFAAELPNDGV